jgi:hypothetical protein
MTAWKSFITLAAELFAAVPFSYGTLGFLMSVDIDIIPYKPYIK